MLQFTFTDVKFQHKYYLLKTLDWYNYNVDLTCYHGYCTQRPVQVTFIPNQESSCCKPWMSTLPGSRVILQGMYVEDMFLKTHVGNWPSKHF